MARLVVKLPKPVFAFRHRVVLTELDPSALPRSLQEKLASRPV